MTPTSGKKKITKTKKKTPPVGGLFTEAPLLLQKTYPKK